AAAHAHPMQDGHVVEERHLEDALQAHGGLPHPALEVPVGAREVLGLEAAALLQARHSVAFLDEAERRHAAAETRPDHDPVEVLCHVPVSALSTRGDRAGLNAWGV